MPRKYSGLSRAETWQAIAVEGTVLAGCQAGPLIFPLVSELLDVGAIGIHHEAAGSRELLQAFLLDFEVYF